MNIALIVLMLTAFPGKQPSEQWYLLSVHPDVGGCQATGKQLPSVWPAFMNSKIKAYKCVPLSEMLK